MSRFKNSSKFKNALVNVHKKETWIHDLNVGSNLSSSGDQIKASCCCVAFIHDSTSVGSVAVLPLNASGRFSQFPLIVGHSRLVTDFVFSPFYDYKLVTGSEDSFVKIWDIPKDDDILTGGCRISNPSLSLGPFDGKVEGLLFHPCADNILAVSSQTSAMIYDLNSQQRFFDLNEHPSVVECVAWGNNGQCLASMSKDGNKKLLQLFDPRSSLTASAKVNYHSGQKHSKVLFMDDTDYLVTAGLGMTREVEIALWDIKKLNTPVILRSLGSSSGNPTLMYDADTKLLFSAVKSESTVTYFDASVSLVPSQQVYRGSLQTKGITMVPKRALNAMSCEVTRLLQLTQNAIIPISYHVQRKSYSEFHKDLFPPTRGGVAAMTAEEWMQGANTEVERVSLEPGKQQVKENNKERVSHAKPVSEEKCGVKQSSEVKAKAPVSSERGITNPTSTDKGSTATKPLNIVRSSKFRHIEGSVKDRSTFISKFPSLNSTVPGDSNAFQVNSTRAAVVFSTAGGQIGVFELNRPGRLDKGPVPTLQNGSAVMDFAFNPFDCNQVLVACEDAKLRLWSIPRDGLEQTLTDPQYLLGHDEKANVLQFHPQAKSIFASAGYDCQLLLWKIPTGIIHVIDHLSAPLFCLCWSPDGSKLATFSKDQILGVYNPRTPGPPVSQGKVNLGSRGARLVWLEETVIALSGFNRTSVRTITLYNTSNLECAITEVTTNISPATLIPYYDRDTKLLFLTGKGDSVILAYEYVSNDPPCLFAVSSFNCGSAHQSVAFLPKAMCDVSAVEIATGLRLTTSTVEGFVVRVPRTRATYFQDDLYPDTLCVEDSSLTAEQWLSGANTMQRVQSLKPPNMKKLSEAPKEPAAAKKFVSYDPKYKTDQQKKEELLSAMIDRMGDKEDDPLPQKDMDGADSDEWSD